MIGGLLITIFVIASAFFCINHLGYSSTGFLSILFKEFKDLLLLRPTVGAINALVLIVNAMLFLFYFANASLDKLIKMSFALQNGSMDSKFGEVLGASLVLSFIGMLCVLICSRQE